MPRAERRNPYALLRRFIEVETRAASLIIGAAVLGVTVASLPRGTDLLHALEHSHVRPVVSEIAIAAFFLLIGLELRREAAHGGLSGRVARVAAIAAVVGMALPAAIFVFAAPAGARSGWVAVVATDIAIASAVALLGVPTEPARVLLLTIAIFDDIGAVLALAFAGGHPPDAVLIPVIVTIVAGYAWAARRFALGGAAAIIVTVLACGVAIAAGLHPSLVAFAIGYLVPRGPTRDGAEPLDERIERRLHPWVAGVLLPAFVFMQTLVPLRMRPGSPVSLVVITMIAILVGKTVGVAGVLVATRSVHGISRTECVAIGFAAAAALTVALIGIDATLRRTVYAQPTALGVLAATAIAGVAGIIVGRIATRRASLR